MGWRRNLAADAGYQPPDAPLSRGLEVHPEGSDRDLAIWIDRKIVPAGYGWSFPADGELRIGVGSFDPRFHVKDNTVKLAEDLGSDAVRFQGNWIPHKLRDSTEDGIFFAGDSAGHCLPLTAEGIRTALHFGLVCGDELREVVAGTRTREQALQRYHAFNDEHEWKFRWMLRVQRLGPAPAPAPAARPGGRDEPPPASDRLGLPALPAHRRARPRRARAQARAGARRRRARGYRRLTTSCPAPGHARRRRTSSPPPAGACPRPPGRTAGPSSMLAAMSDRCGASGSRGRLAALAVPARSRSRSRGPRPGRSRA